MRAFTTGILLVLLTGVNGQRSPFNGRVVQQPDSTGRYRLLIGGHFHGSSDGRSGFPAATLLAGLDTINSLRPHMLLSTGDLFLAPDQDSARYQRSFFSKLNVPLFNAPGNHDLEGSTYLRSYAPTHSVLEIGNDRVVILDTERNNGDLIDDQLELLRSQADPILGFQGANLFIVTHRPVWSEDDERYSTLFAGNTRSTFGNNFRKDIHPLLERIAQRAQVFWISGSMAGRAPASIFFQPEGKGLTYIQTALRDLPRDALLLADVGPEGIHWSTLSLTGLPVEAPEVYDAMYWRARQGDTEEFNWRLLPYLVQKVLARAEFWYGAGAGILLLVLLRRLFRRGF